MTRAGRWAWVRCLAAGGCIGLGWGCSTAGSSPEAAGAATGGGGTSAMVAVSGQGGANGGNGSNAGAGGASSGRSNNGGVAGECRRDAVSTCGNTSHIAGEACAVEGFGCYDQQAEPCNVQNYYTAFSCCCGRWVARPGNDPSRTLSCEDLARGVGGGRFVDCSAGGAGGEGVGGAGGAGGADGS